MYIGIFNFESITFKSFCSLVWAGVGANVVLTGGTVGTVGTTGEEIRPKLSTVSPSQDLPFVPSMLISTLVIKVSPAFIVSLDNPFNAFNCSTVVPVDCAITERVSPF